MSHADVQSSNDSMIRPGEPHAPPSPDPISNRRFLTTEWSLIAQANLPESESREALEQLCRKYWKPLCAFANSRGFDHDQSQELTQAFIAHLLEKRALAKADRERGRFRTFLITSFKNFINNQWRAEQTKKRGGSHEIVSLDLIGDHLHAKQGIDELTPEKVFNHNWAMTLLQKAMADLEQSYGEEGKQTLFQAMKPLLIGDDEASQTEIAQQLQMSSGALRVAIHRMRKRYSQLLRQEISQTVSSEAEIDDELRDMIQALSYR